MTIKFKFPAIILYVDKVQKGKGYVVRGKAVAFFAIIGKYYSRDLGLLAHELTHVKEWWTHGLLIHNILYGAIRLYRLHSECKAYYQQWLTEPTPEKKKDFTYRIWLFYNLKYSREFVEETFEKYFKQKKVKKMDENILTEGEQVCHQCPILTLDREKNTYFCPISGFYLPYRDCYMKSITLIDGKKFKPSKCKTKCNKV